MSSSTLQERARALANAQDFGSEALELNRQLAAADPADAASRTRLGRCYLQAGRLDESEAEYREVLRLDPRNLIAAGGLAAVERQRHAGERAPEPPRPTRAPRVSGAVVPRRAPAPPAFDGPPPPKIFSGLQPRDFAELRLCSRTEAQARFAPRVLDLLKRVNALQSSIEIAGIREPGRRQLFRLSRAEVHGDAGRWSVSQMGERSEPQFGIGMLAGVRAGGDWLRVGLGLDLADGGQVYVRRFQEVLGSPRRSLFLGWMIKEEGLVELGGPGPRLDLRDAAQAADAIGQIDPARAGRVFLGKWLSPEQPADASILGDPVSLVRTIDRVFTGLLPLWRAILGA